MLNFKPTFLLSSFTFIKRLFSSSLSAINGWCHLRICSFQLLSRVRLCDPMNHSTPGLPVHHQLPEFTQTHVHQVGNAVQPSHPLSFPSPPAPNPSQHQGLFPDESVLPIKSSKYWSFIFGISPSNEHPGLISFGMVWLDLLAVQWTLKRVFSNTTVQKHQFFDAQLSL